MIYRLAAIPFALLVLTDCAPAGGSENLMPEFFAFEARTKDLAPDIRADQFMKEIAASHPEFYDDTKLFGPPAELRKDALGLLDPARPETLPGLPPLSEQRFRVVASTIETDFAAARSKFLATFPDCRCDAAIEFGPSFLQFDGHDYKDRGGQVHMLFGVDTIAVLHEPEDMPAFFTHELFHVYHRQLMGSHIPRANRVTWWVMWDEGLATYASQRLNPTLDAQHVLWFPRDIVRQMETSGARAHAAKLMIADFDKSNTRWFDAGRSAPGDLPPRTGYYMGYELAASLGRDHSLDWLAHLPPADVKVEARKFLEGESL
jgi:hypothetical protein